MPSARKLAHAVPPFDPALRLADAASAVRDRLAAAGIEEAGTEAEVLLAAVLGTTRGGVHAGAITGRELTVEQAQAVSAATLRRATREPLQHIVGLAPFRTLELEVGPGVFVPRPETELVAGLAIDHLRTRAEPEPIAVDLGTGSGAIALSLAAEVAHARVHAVENAPAAYAWARRNIARTGLDVHLVFADLAVALPELDGRVGVLVSNPPYVPEAMVPRTPEVYLHDPASALYGGVDGLDVVRVIAPTALRLLAPGGALVVEHAEHQGEAVRAIFAEAGLRAPRTHRDLTGRYRVTTAQR